MFLPDPGLDSVEEFKQFNLSSLFKEEYKLVIGGSIHIKEKYMGFHEILVLNGVPVTESVPDFVEIREETGSIIESWNPFINFNCNFNKTKYNLIFKNNSIKPVIIRNIFTNDKSYIPSNIRYTVSENCSIDLLEICESDKDILIINNREINLNNSELNYASKQYVSSNTNLIYNYNGEVSDSVLNVVTFNDSGNICINNWNVNLLTPESVSHINGVVKLNERMKHGTVCKIYHHDKETESSQEFRHILDDDSTAMYDGDSSMTDKATDSVSTQQTKTIMLSDNARILNKPRLNIFTGEVKATHGASVGKLDEDEIFYLKQRGFPERVIKLILLDAFTADLLNRIKSNAVREVINDKR